MGEDVTGQGSNNHYPEDGVLCAHVGVGASGMRGLRRWRGGRVARAAGRSFKEVKTLKPLSSVIRSNTRNKRSLYRSQSLIRCGGPPAFPLFETATYFDQNLMKSP